MDQTKLRGLAAEYLEAMINYRRHLHTHPEPSFEEKETQAFIISVLEAQGIPYRVTERFYSVVARIKGEKPGKTVAFRADIDALRLTEENDAPYRSVNEGVMHACGHDAHTAALLGFACMMQAHRELIEGELVLIFQHAEEIMPGGAVTVIGEGFLDGVDAIFGAHVRASLETGSVAFTSGPAMASADMFTLRVRGAGGHAAQPHQLRDPVVAGAALVTQLQTIVSRTVDPLLPAVVSVCEFHAGTGFNIIPQEAVLRGTVRCFDPKLRDLIEQRMHAIAAGICAAHGAEYELDYVRGYPALVNDSALTELAKASVERLAGRRTVWAEPVMGGEDFAYYLQKVPGCFMFVGAGGAGEGPLRRGHSPNFDLDEASLAVTLESFLAVYLGYLDGNRA